MRRLWTGMGIVGMLLTSTPLFAQIDARMFRYPDVSATHIVFVYAGDIWVVPKTGGLAHHLSSPPGEESFPRFSPDGKWLAFSGNYEGNTDVYVVPALGGTPKRLTHHPMPERVLDWYPDGNQILFASAMESGRQRFRQLYRVSRDGGLPEKLPVPYGEFGSISPDGKWLAFMPKARDFRTWKRYRGGWAPDIWLFNLKTYESKNLTRNDANDAHPMWHGRTVYFLSDRGPAQRYNIWAYNMDDDSFRQITHFKDYDIHFPAIGPNDIVFEAGGKLYLLDLNTEQYREVPVEVITDQATLNPKPVKVDKWILTANISPSGKRALFEARGDIFSVPAEHGAIFNLTHSSGVAERFPAWSPDGKYVAYWSDRSGEYELYLRRADGSGEERKLTRLGPGFRYHLYWSPDSKKLAFIDNTMTIRIIDVESGRLIRVDQGLWMFHGALNNFRVSWSADSRWLAYARGLDNRHGAVFLFDTRDGRRHQVTSGYYNDSQPVFDPDGKYLYYFSNRTLKPVYSDLDNTWVYPNTTNIVAVPLRPDVPSPLAPKNDEEAVKKEDSGETKKDEKKDKQKKENGKAGPVHITLEGFEQRAVILPPKAGNYTDLMAVSGKVIYRRYPRTGSDNEKKPLMYYDLKDRKEQTILDDVDGVRLSADGKKLLVWKKRRFAIVDVKPKQKMDKPLRTGEMEMTIVPKDEWRQVFNDAWRFERDFFYDPNMHGVDWNAMRKQYSRLLDDAVTRWDVNYVIGELIAELNASHAYRGGGDVESPRRRGVGLLGIDWSLENGAYRIKRIIRGAPWDIEVRSPFDEPGVDVKEGDYILAVNGIPLDTSKDPWAAFQGLAGKTVVLTVNDRPSMEGARQVVVKTLTSETRLRHLAWIEANRKKVEEATKGRVGYIYVRSTGIDGQTELLRQFLAQFPKDGLIIDERFNSGGQIPDRFIELLNRPALSYWAVRDGRDWQWPPFAHFGPKVMLINGWSGSGGDAFPYYFKRAGLGPLIGERTWGGLIGITGAPPLVDGGRVTVPTFRMYSPEGEWFPEGHGVDPDIPVVDDPSLMARGRDPQLERAIEEVLRLLETHPPLRPKRPPYERRTATDNGSR